MIPGNGNAGVRALQIYRLSLKPTVLVKDSISPATATISTITFDIFKKVKMLLAWCALNSGYAITSKAVLR